MNIRSQQSLQSYNTFGIKAFAARFAEVHSVEALRELLRANITPLQVLGGGSNILLTGDLSGLVLKMAIGGVEITEEDDRSAVIAAGAGFHWHRLVEWTLDRNLGGLENLSLIPGTAGAAPIQNIGAYGAELKDVFEKLEAMEVATGRQVVFTSADCLFGYRHSIFKGELSGRYIITKVYLRLSKQPQLRLSYTNLADTLREMGAAQPTIRDVSRAVIRIRQSKLPDPAVTGNAGSFFRNPEIGEDQLADLMKRHGDLPHYALPEGRIKIPAGWLIEKAGWKGYRVGDAGCHERQALVLVNHGHASGKEILQLARRIQISIAELFGITLQPEVNIW